MIVTRVAYGLIILVIALAVVAVVIVLRPNAASTPPALEFQQVVNYSKYGVVELIDVRGQALTVRFRSDFDTRAQFGVDAREFSAVVPPGQDVGAALTAAGVTYNQGGGSLQVVRR